MRGVINIGGIITALVLIVVGTYVTYTVVTELENQMGNNLTGLWALVFTLLKIFAPVFFILLAVSVFKIGQ